MSEPVLTIIRGLPGSGKSTVARALWLTLKPTAEWVETDMFWEERNGGKFDRARAGEAHDWCRRKVARRLSQGFSAIVSNTFTTAEEMEPYLAMAREHRAQVQVIVVKGPWESVHGVPAETMERMRARWQDSIA